MNASSGGLITGKLGLSSKFLDIGKLNAGGGDEHHKALSTQKRASILPNPLSFSNRASGRINKRQGLGLATNN